MKESENTTEESTRLSRRSFLASVGVILGGIAFLGRNQINTALHQAAESMRGEPTVAEVKKLLEAQFPDAAIEVTEQPNGHIVVVIVEDTDSANPPPNFPQMSEDTLRAIGALGPCAREHKQVTVFSPTLNGKAQNARLLQTSFRSQADGLIADKLALNTILNTTIDGIGDPADELILQGQEPGSKFFNDSSSQKKQLTEQASRAFGDAAHGVLEGSILFKGNVDYAQAGRSAQRPHGLDGKTGMEVLVVSPEEKGDVLNQVQAYKAGHPVTIVRLDLTNHR